MPKRFFLPLVLCLSVACATPRNDMSPDTGRSTLTQYYGTVTVDVHNTVDPSSHIIGTSVDSVWRVLRSVYQDLDVAPNVIDRRGYQIGNTRFDPRSIGGQRLSRFLRCGYSVSTSNNADSYRVTMSLVTRVRVDVQRQTVLQTEITASAKPRMVSGNAIACTTTGRLERRIAEMVAEKLSGENESLR